jgi:hypothetical protein
MKISPKPKNESRSRIGRIATAVAFALVIAFIPLAQAPAAEHGGGHGGHGDGHGGGGYHGGYHGGGHWGGGYYAPGPDIYVAPEPYVYTPGPCPPDYEPPYYEGPDYYCSPPPPPGINLFFGL